MNHPTSSPRPLTLAAIVAVLAAVLPAVVGAEDPSAPGGTAAFFNGTGTCPDGWQELSAASGRLIVGVTDGHEVGGTSGRPLDDGEDPVHKHHLSTTVKLEKKGIAALTSCCNRNAANNGTHNVTGTAQEASTNLPFVQLLMCENKSSRGGASASGDDLPQGAILFFDLGACPAGWATLSDAAGRLVVPSPSPDGNGVKVGAALANSEEAFSHAHTIDLEFKPNGASFAASGGSTHRARRKTYEIGGTTAADSAGLPYLQLLACRKTAAPAGPPDGLPEGLLTFFDGASCPAGFSEPTDLRGRLLVAVPRFGAIGKTFGGPPLASGEKRMHSHPQSAKIELPGKKLAIASGCCRDGFAKKGLYDIDASKGGSTQGASTVGYVQYLQCEKD